MKRSLRLIATLIIAITALTGFASVWAQDQVEDPEREGTIEAHEATIPALETPAAELKTTPGTSQTGASTQQTPVAGSEPTLISNAFVVLYYYVVHNEGELAIYGEIQNVSSAGQLVPNIRFMFFDENGNFYLLEEAQPVSRWVEAGQRMPFQYFSPLGGAVAPGESARVEVAAGSPASHYYIHDTSMLTIEDAPIEGPRQIVSGRIRNHGSTPVTGLFIYEAYYDEQGVLVGACVGSNLSSDAIIPPGETIGFEAGGGCGLTDRATEERGSQGPLTQRLIIFRNE